MKKVKLELVKKSRTKQFGKKNRVKFAKTYAADKLSTKEIKGFLDALMKFKQTPKNIAEMEKLIRFYSLGIPAIGKAKWTIKKEKDSVMAILALPVEFSDLPGIPPLNRFLLRLEVAKTRKKSNELTLEISYDTINEQKGWDIQYFNVHKMILSDEELTELYSELDRYFRTNDLMGEMQDIYSLMEDEIDEIDDTAFDEELESEDDMDLFEDDDRPRFSRKKMRKMDGSGDNPDCPYKGLFD